MERRFTIEKNYGTIQKKLWYYTENYETLIFYEIK